MQNQITNDWQKKQLGEVIQTLKGFAFKSKWYSNEGKPLIKVTSFTNDSIDESQLDFIEDNIAKDYIPKYEAKLGDILIQTVGSWPSNPGSVVGRVVNVPLEIDGALLNQNIVKIIPKIAIEKRYLYYLLRSNLFKNFIV